MKPVRIQIILGILATAFLINVSYITDASAWWWWYKGPWYMYYSPHNMHILVETDSGIDDDDNHRYLELTCLCGDGCNDEPKVGYSRKKIEINNARDRWVWNMYAHDLTPDCQYEVTFSYRETWIDEWHYVGGYFWTPPEGNPSEMEFYAFGDQRALDDSNKDVVEKVSEAVMNHKGKKTFILNSGDIAYMGGYKFEDHDYWKHYFRNDHTRDLLSEMPMFPSIGNHDMDNGSGYDDGDATNYTRYFPYTDITDDPSKVYYHRQWGRVNIYSLTSFPMNTNHYCSTHNDNYKPKDKGGTGQYDWLEGKLKEIEDDPYQWKIVMMHAPIYSPDACNNQDDAKDWLVPLFKKYEVDMFVGGHNHYYARTTHSGGITYLILGGAGGGLSLSKCCRTNGETGCDDDQKENPCKSFDPDLVMNKHHFVYFKLSGDVLTGEVFDENNNLIDKFEIDKSPTAGFGFTHQASESRGAKGFLKVGASPDAGGPPPLTVKFTDTSTGKRHRYQWDFGDGTVTEVLNGIDASTEHTYTKEGTYTVKLSIWSAYGSHVHTKTAAINVYNMANFSADPLEVAIQQPVTFTDKSAGNVTEWTWDFGDGNTSTERNPVHPYTKSGIFPVKLTINRGSAGTRTTVTTKHGYIKVKPYADFSYHVSAPASDPGSSDEAVYETHFFNKSAGGNLTYNWDFGDATTSSGANPTHNYDTICERVVLTVSDGKNLDSRAKYIELGSGMPSLKQADDRLVVELNNILCQGEHYKATLVSEDHHIYSLVDDSVADASQTFYVQATVSEDMGIHIPEIFFDAKSWNMKLKYIPDPDKLMWEVETFEENVTVPMIFR